MLVFLSRIQYVCLPINIFKGYQGNLGKSGEGTQSSCITSSSLVSYAAIFVPIFTQCNNTQKKPHKLILPSYLSSCALQYCLSFQTKMMNPCMEFRRNLSKCIILFLFKETHGNKYIVHIRLNYKAT